MMVRLRWKRWPGRARPVSDGVIDWNDKPRLMARFVIPKHVRACYTEVMRLLMAV